MFGEDEYKLLHSLAFRDDYPGYRQDVIESPDGDGKWDTRKKYAHIANKYLVKDKDKTRKAVFQYFLDKCHEEALRVSRSIGIPWNMLPDKDYSTLRILEYPPKAITHSHVDFDLFTLLLYRNIQETFRYVNDPPPRKIREISPGIHYGEILEIVNGETPTRHKVLGHQETQKSMVYFAIPNWDERLTVDLTVGEWLRERLRKSRGTK